MRRTQKRESQATALAASIVTIGYVIFVLPVEYVLTGFAAAVYQGKPVNQYDEALQGANYAVWWFAAVVAVQALVMVGAIVLYRSMLRETTRVLRHDRHVDW
jgi:hypothetical protein